MKVVYMQYKSGIFIVIKVTLDCPGGLMVKTLVSYARGSIPSWGTKIPHAMWCDQHINK